MFWRRLRSKGVLLLERGLVFCFPKLNGFGDDETIHELELPLATEHTVLCIRHLSLDGGKHAIIILIFLLSKFAFIIEILEILHLGFQNPTLGNQILNGKTGQILVLVDLLEVRHLNGLRVGSNYQLIEINIQFYFPEKNFCCWFVKEEKY